MNNFLKNGLVGVLFFVMAIFGCITIDNGEFGIANAKTEFTGIARPVATVDGKKVYSDKEMISVTNTRVSFSDGSWCDVATGEVVNKGPGYINIGAPSSENGGKKETVSDVLTGVKLEVKDLIATDVEIIPYNGSKVEVIKNGYKGHIDDIKVYEADNVVVVEEEGVQGGGSSISVSTIHSASVSLISTSNRSSSVVIGNSSDENDTKVTIKVPKGFPVSISDIDGLSTVGDTEGPFQVNSSMGDVRAGSVGDTMINIQGSGDVRINEVKDGLSVSIQGSGDVKVKKGEVDFLNVNIQGSGGAKYGGRATNATLTVMGSGDIDVEYVKNKPITKSMGSGDIQVGNWQN